MNATKFHNTPYVGLTPFSENDADRFFGREDVRDLVCNYLQAERVTTLYGASGVGKSSLLRAGVVPDLNRMAKENAGAGGSPEFCVVMFTDWTADPLVALKQRVREAIESSGAPIALDDPKDLPLYETLTAWTKRTGFGLLIILDQFEEHFLYHSPQVIDQFAEQLRRIVTDSHLSINFVISVRDDGLAKLDRFRVRLPRLFTNMLRVKHLTREAGRAAVLGPIGEYNRNLGPSEQPFEIEDALIEEVLVQVSTRVTPGTNIPAASTRGSHVEAPYLQLVMTRLWKEEIRKGSHRLRLSTLKELGGAHKIVDSHLSLTIEKFSAEDEKIAANIFRYLVTPSGTKIAQTTEDLAAYSNIEASEIQRVLEELSQLRILRTISPPPDKPEAPRYEIFHDVLATPINAWWQQYASDQRMKELEESNLRQKQIYRGRIAGVGFLAASILVIVMTTLAATNYRQKSVIAGQNLELSLRNEQLVGEKQRADRSASFAASSLVTSNVARGDALISALRAKTAGDAAQSQKVLAQNRLADAQAAQQVDTMHREGLVAFERGETKSAREIFQNLFKQYGKKRNREGQGWADYTLGAIFRRDGRYYEAIQAYLDARQLRETAHSDNRDVAATIIRLAQTYHELGDYEAAEKAYKEVLDRLRCSSDGDNSRCIEIKSDLADLSRNQARDAAWAALEAEEKGDEIDNQIYNLGVFRAGTETAAKHVELNDQKARYEKEQHAQELLKTEEYGEAVNLYLEVIKFREANLPPNHADLAEAYNNLASLYEDEGLSDSSMKEEARKLRELAQAILTNRPVPDRHDKLEADKISLLAKVYARQNKPKLAEKLYVKLEEAAVDATSPRDHYVVVKLKEVVEFYRSQQNYTAAESSATKVLEILSGRDNRDERARFLGVVADIYDQDGKPDAAETYASDAVKIRQEISSNVFDDLRCIQHLAVLFEKHQKFTEAEASYKRGVEVAQVIGQKGWLGWMNAFAGRFYYDQNRYDEAAVYYENAYKILVGRMQQARSEPIQPLGYSRILTFESDPSYNRLVSPASYIEVFFNLAAIRTKQQNYVQSEAIYKESIESLEWLRRYLPTSIPMKFYPAEKKTPELRKYDLLYAQALESYAAALKPQGRLEDAQKFEKLAQSARSETSSIKETLQPPKP
jgi:tetratricopeptide (TPR) repeat protein